LVLQWGQSLVCTLPLLMMNFILRGYVTQNDSRGLCDGEHTGTGSSGTLAADATKKALSAVRLGHPSYAI